MLPHPSHCSSSFCMIGRCVVISLSCMFSPPASLPPPSPQHYSSTHSNLYWYIPIPRCSADLERWATVDSSCDGWFLIRIRVEELRGSIKPYSHNCLCTGHLLHYLATTAVQGAAFDPLPFQLLLRPQRDSWVWTLPADSSRGKQTTDEGVAVRPSTSHTGESVDVVRPPAPSLRCHTPGTSKLLQGDPPPCRCPVGLALPASSATGACALGSGSSAERVSYFHGTPSLR